MSEQQEVWWRNNPPSGGPPCAGSLPLRAPGAVLLVTLRLCLSSFDGVSFEYLIISLVNYSLPALWFWTETAYLFRIHRFTTQHPQLTVQNIAFMMFGFSAFHLLFSSEVFFGSFPPTMDEWNGKLFVSVLQDQSWVDVIWSQLAIFFTVCFLVTQKSCFQKRTITISSFRINAGRGDAYIVSHFFGQFPHKNVRGARGLVEK